jgi:hypothetical protein
MAHRRTVRHFHEVGHLRELTFSYCRGLEMVVGRILSRRSTKTATSEAACDPRFARRSRHLTAGQKSTGGASGSTSVSVFRQKGESPIQANALRLVAERNRVAARRSWGVPQGEWLVHNESELDSAGCFGEPAANWRSPDRKRKPVALRGSVSKRRRGTSGGWRWNGRKAEHMKQRDLRGTRPRRVGVRGVIVALKPGNAGGAKGSRKMDDE